MIDVPVNPGLRLTFRSSATVSPTVVQQILIIQKRIVTSGDLVQSPEAQATSTFDCVPTLTTMSPSLGLRCQQHAFHRNLRPARTKLGVRA